MVWNPAKLLLNVAAPRNLNTHATPVTLAVPDSSGHPSGEQASRAA